MEKLFHVVEDNKPQFSACVIGKGATVFLFMTSKLNFFKKIELRFQKSIMKNRNFFMTNKLYLAKEINRKSSIYWLPVIAKYCKLRRTSAS